MEDTRRWRSCATTPAPPTKSSRSSSKHAIRQAPARVTWADRPLSELTDHIAETFHQPLLLELPRLRALITRLQGHGARTAMC